MQRQLSFLHYFIILASLALYPRLVEADSFDQPSLITRRMSISSQPKFQNWQLTDQEQQKTITQLILPLNVDFSLSSRTRIQITQSHVRSDLQSKSVGNQPDIERIELLGFGDVKAKLFHVFSDRFLLVGGLSLPTGKKEINREENMVSAALFDQSLDFEVGRLGEGWGFNLGTGYVHSFSNATVSLGANYLYRDSYLKKYLDFMIENPVYDPGQEYSMAVGIDVGKDTIQWRSDAVYTYHTPETLDQKNYFRQGSNLLLDSGLAYIKHRFQIELFGQYLRYWDSKRPDSEGDLDILIYDLNNRWVYGISARYRVGQKTTVFGSISDKQIRTHSDKKFSAIRAYALNLFYRLTPYLAFTSGVKISSGDMTQQVELSGLSLYAALTTGF